MRAWRGKKQRGMPCIIFAKQHVLLDRLFKFSNNNIVHTQVYGSTWNPWACFVLLNNVYDTCPHGWHVKGGRNHKSPPQNAYDVVGPFCIVYCWPRPIVSNLIHPAFLNSMLGVGREREVWWGVRQGICKKLRGRKSSFDCDRRKKTLNLTCIHMCECTRRESCHGKNNLSPGYILSGSSATTMFASTTASGERP